MRNVYYGSNGSNGHYMVEVANGSSYAKLEKHRPKSPNSIKLTQPQSMTNEETRQLTGFVAKTRAIFESRENLDSKPSTHQFLSNQNLSFTKMSPSLLSTSQTSSSVSKLNEAKIAFLSSPNATNYTPLLKKTSNKENEKSDESKKVNEVIKNFTFSSTSNGMEKFKTPSKFKSDIYAHENNSNEIFINEVSFRPQDSSDYKYQNLSANSILTNNSFKPIISKFKKFSLANEVSPYRAATTTTTIAYENECENDNSHNSSSETSNSDLDKPNYNLKTSVKQAKLCFENMANSNEKSPQTIHVNGNSKPNSSIIKIKSNNFRDRFSVGNVNKSSDDNSSASSVSSISSLNSYGSSVQNKVASGEINHCTNFAQLANRFNNSNQITPSVSENTFAEKSSLASDKNPNLRFAATKDKNLSSPTHNAFSTCSSSSSSFDLHSNTQKSNDSSAVNSPRSSNNVSSTFSVNKNNDAVANVKHKIVKLDNYVSHIAKEIISDYKEDSDSASGEENNRRVHVSTANLSPKTISVNKSVSRIKVIHDDKSHQRAHENKATESNFSNCTSNNTPNYSYSRVRQLAQNVEKPFQRQSQPAEINYFKNDKNSEPVRVDNTSCVLPSKIKTRSHSLVDPKQVQMSISQAVNSTPQTKR